MLTRKGHQAIAPDICKHVYTEFPAAREILSRHGKLKGLLQECPYLTMTGAAHGGTYTLNLNADIYYRVMDSQELSSHTKYTFVTVVVLTVLLFQLCTKMIVIIFLLGRRDCYR